MAEWDDVDRCRKRPFRGRRIADQPRIGPVCAVASDSVAGVVRDQPQFFAAFYRDRHRSRRVAFPHDPTVEDLLVIDVHPEDHRCHVLSALPLDANVRLERPELPTQFHDDLPVGMVAQPMPVLFVLDAEAHRFLVERTHRGVETEITPALNHRDDAVGETVREVLGGRRLGAGACCTERANGRERGCQKKCCIVGS